MRVFPVIPEISKVLEHKFEEGRISIKCPIVRRDMPNINMALSL